MKSAKFLCFVAGLTVVLLTGCQNVKEELGVGRNSPDEFMVVKRAPLSLPPEYGLRPPADGSAPSSIIASNRAKTILLGKVEEPVKKGSGEILLLKKMNVENAAPNIRDTIDMENGYLALKNKSLADKLLFWQDEDAEKLDGRIPVSVVDPKKEKERIDENKKEGSPVNTGDVPVIEKKKGTIDKLF